MHQFTYLFLFFSFLFNKTIAHKIDIYDFNGNPISNVNISCGEVSTTSNKDGFFKINCDSETQIFLSHIKYKTTIIEDKSINSIILTEKHLILDDVEIFGGLNASNKFTNISVISNDKFKLNGKNHLEDLLSSSANLNFSGGTSRAQYYQIRGLGELSQFSGEGPPHFYVGYIIDDIDFSGIGMIGFLNDIKQVEIFKGPQSMSYGPNSMAGIINLVSNEPTDFFDFNTQISFSSNNGYHITSVLSIPFHKNLLSRFTIMNNYTDGMIVNKFKNISNSNSKDEKLFRGKFTYTPDNSTEINLTIYNIDLNNKYDVWTPDNNGFTTFTDYQGYDKQNTQAFSLKSIFQIENGIITNISSYSDNKMIYSYDGDWANNEYWHQEPYNWDSNYWGYEWDFPDYTDRNRISKSNELRINQIINKNLSCTIGFYLSETNEKDNRTGYLFAGFADNIKSNFLLKNYAIYIQVTNQINNLSKIIYTLRTDINSTKQNLEFSKYDWYTYTNVIDNFSGYIKDKKLHGGSIQYIHSMDEKTNISLSLSRGYKTSGINQTQSSYFLNYENELRYYTTEYSNNMEIGISYVSDNLSYKITNFYLYRLNPQLRLFYQFDLANPNSFDYATINSDYGYNYGIESDFTAHINNEFSIYATLSTLKTYISKFVFEGNVYGDRETAHSPNSTLSLGIDFDLSKYVNGLSINLNSYYKSSFYFDDQNNHKSTPYAISNCSVIYIFKHLELSIWGKNIFNKKYPVRGYTFALDPTFEVKDWQSFADLSTFGLTINYNF